MRFPIETVPMADADCRSHASGTHKIIKSLAGRARALHELASGVPAEEGDPAYGRNPQGDPGVDLSGPPWGSAILHPIAVIAYSPNAAGTAMSQPTQVAEGKMFSRYADADHPLHFETHAWVRPHAKLPEPSEAPYSRGYVSFLYQRSAAPSPDGTLSLWSNDQSVRDAMTHTWTASSATVARVTPVDAWFVLEPGWNHLHFRLEVTGATAIFFPSLIIYNRRKRTH